MDAYAASEEEGLRGLVVFVCPSARSARADGGYRLVIPKDTYSSISITPTTFDKSYKMRCGPMYECESKNVIQLSNKRIIQNQRKTKLHQNEERLVRRQTDTPAKSPAGIKGAKNDQRAKRVQEGTALEKSTLCNAVQRKLPNHVPDPGNAALSKNRAGMCTRETMVTETNGERGRMYTNVVYAEGHDQITT